MGEYGETRVSPIVINWQKVSCHVIFELGYNELGYNGQIFRFHSQKSIYYIN